MQDNCRWFFQRLHLPKKRTSARLFSAALSMHWLFAFLLLAVGIGAGQVGGTEMPASDVNPFVGTGRGPGPFVNSNSENLFPGAALPFGMVQLSPDTENHGFGYHYLQNDVQGFSMTHMS